VGLNTFFGALFRNHYKEPWEGDEQIRGHPTPLINPSLPSWNFKNLYSICLSFVTLYYSQNKVPFPSNLQNPGVWKMKFCENNTERPLEESIGFSSTWVLHQENSEDLATCDHQRPEDSTKDLEYLGFPGWIGYPRSTQMVPKTMSLRKLKIVHDQPLYNTWVCPILSGNYLRICLAQWAHHRFFFPFLWMTRNTQWIPGFHTELEVRKCSEFYYANKHSVTVIKYLRKSFFFKLTVLEAPVRGWTHKLLWASGELFRWQWQGADRRANCSPHGQKIRKRKKEPGFHNHL
jgi:hypothetical protein